MAKALGVVLGPAEPTAQKPEQLLAGIVQCAAMACSQFGESWLQLHQVVKAFDQGFHPGFSAQPLERGGKGLTVLFAG